MQTHLTAVGLLTMCAMAPSLAFAQRFPFERTFQIAGPAKLDVSTVRGRIEISTGPPDRIVVEGVATVRTAWDAPSNAVELARQVAANPPLEQAGDTLRLAIPTDGATRRAVTVSYHVRVPPATEVRASSESGETSVRGITAPVNVRTQSGAIDLRELAGLVSVSSESGAVSAADITGALSVTTSSSSITGSGLGSSLKVRTQSGAVQADLTGSGDVEVETGSSEIRLRGVRGGLVAKTQSGRVTVQGAPGRAWAATTGSSSVNLDVEIGVGFSVDAVSRSGSVVVEGGEIQGSVTKGAVKGTINGGGVPVRVSSGSGSIRIQLGTR